jgi:hypothetical protein
MEMKQLIKHDPEVWLQLPVPNGQAPATVQAINARRHELGLVPIDEETLLAAAEGIQPLDGNTNPGFLLLIEPLLPAVLVNVETLDTTGADSLLEVVVAHSGAADQLTDDTSPLDLVGFTYEDGAAGFRHARFTSVYETYPDLKDEPYGSTILVALSYYRALPNTNRMLAATTLTARVEFAAIIDAEIVDLLVALS